MPIAYPFAIAMSISVSAVSVSGDELRANFFGDPFVHVTNGIKECPVPHGPEITREDMRRASHLRAEHGTRCYQAGKCRLPNSYMYDKDIITRVEKAIHADGRFANTSIWAEGQRRWVWLKGCVRRPEDAKAVVELVREIDEVNRVFDELRVLKAAHSDTRNTPGTHQSR